MGKLRLRAFNYFRLQNLGKGPALWLRHLNGASKMQTRKKPAKHNLTKSQERMVKDSLKRFLGYGLIEDSVKTSHLKTLILKDALNSLVLK